MSEKEQIVDYIERNKYSYMEMSDRIDEGGEVGNEEIFGCGSLIDGLKEDDFEIETEIVGDGSGFIGRYDWGVEGGGIGFLGE